MSKIDEMRRRREAQYAQQQRQRDVAKRQPSGERDAPPAKRPSLQVVPPLVEVAVAGDIPVEPVPPANDVKPTEVKAGRVIAPQGRSSRPADTDGKCSVCGKVKSVQNGVVVSHQKGLGKMCAGSRKPPA
jgi:hypothetical protein